MKTILGAIGILFIIFFVWLVAKAFQSMVNFVVKTVYDAKNRIKKDNNVSADRITYRRNDNFIVYDYLTECPFCKRQFPIKDNYIGKKTYCKNCSNLFVVTKKE
ncbi:MAG: hypothetical protein LBP22_15815 [Deltaproteobacteria bacterium]|nr:hypothetical protein [Deltaproteobacteria bacterium]